MTKQMSVIRQIHGKLRSPKPAWCVGPYAKSAKGSLRTYLVRRFPLAYEILFTPGNMDESLGALIAGQRSIKRLMKRPGTRELVKSYPQIVYRSFRKYLATSFTKKDRRAVLKHHYGYLLSRVREIFFTDILLNHPKIWQKTIDQDCLSITLSFPGELHHEGDLLLEFRQNGLALYSLSFTIAPGRSTTSTASEVILVARVQGIAGRFEAIRQATKICRDVSPSYLLMAALQGISLALNVTVIAGVKNCEQVTAGLADEERAVYFDYDVFWQTHMGTDKGKFYLMSVPVQDKPLALISPSHRRRTRAKRQFKNEVVDMSKDRFDVLCVGPSIKAPIARLETSA